MKLHFEKHGDAERSLVIIHGFLGSGENWRTIARQLSEHFTVYLPDIRNHGKSEHADEMSYELLAADIKVFVEEHVDQENVDLIGHSMGGKIGFQLAETYPGILNSLLVVDIAPKEYEGGHEAILDAMQSLNLDAVKNRKDANHLLSEGISDQVVRQFILKNLVREESGEYEWRIPIKTLIDNYSQIKTGISFTERKKPRLSLIYGARSGYVNQNDLNDLGQAFPEFSSFEMDAGHWVHAEKPSAFLERVKKHLKILA